MRITEQATCRLKLYAVLAKQLSGLEEKYSADSPADRWREGAFDQRLPIFAMGCRNAN
jgi:hypothetical protein